MRHNLFHKRIPKFCLSKEIAGMWKIDCLKGNLLPQSHTIYTALCLRTLVNFLFLSVYCESLYGSLHNCLVFQMEA